MLDKQELYRKIWKLTLPMLLSRFMDSTITAADVIMTNYVGQTALSATSLASQYNSIAFMVFFGITVGATLLGSQYWGKKDLKAVERVQGIALRYTMAFGLLFMILYLAFPAPLMKIFTTDSDLIDQGVRYLRILAPGVFCWSISSVYISSLETIERVRTGTVIRVVTLIFDTGMTAVFIFGLFGMPELGVTGVALATSSSHILQLIMCLIVSATSHDIKLNFRNILIPDKDLNSDFIRTVVPAAANDISWGLAFTMYSVIFGHLGSDTVAANSVVSTVRGFAQVFCFSLSGSTLLIIGQYLGRARSMRQRKPAVI